MIRISAPAKINLALDVLKRRPDRFHEIDTVFLAIEWCDELTVDFAAQNSDEFRIAGPAAEGIPADASNLVARAIELLRQQTAVPPLRIGLTKTIPSGAGLGGGSSDAAAAIRATNDLLELQLEPSEMERLVARIGSDCPFFIRAGAQRGRGRGDILEPLDYNRDLALLLAVPPIAVSTPEAYRLLEPEDFGPKADLENLAHWMAGQRDDVPELHNAFQRGVAARHPEIAATLAELKRLGALRACLSGSGSACFGLFESVRECDAAAKQWALAGCRVLACKPCGDR